jgi:hypothetical protein
MIVPVAQSYAHVVQVYVGDADREAQSQQTLRYPKHNEAAATAEQDAGDRSPQQRYDGEDNIGQVSQGE